MSYKITDWVWKNSRARGPAHHVLLAIADRADDEGVAWPSMGDIAKRCRIGIATVQRAIPKLVDIGELEVFEGGVGARSNRYRVITDRHTSNGDAFRSGTQSVPERNTNGATSYSAPEGQRSGAEGTCSGAEGQRSAPSTEPVTNQSENQSRNRSTPPAPEPKALPDQMLAKWWEQYGRRTAQGKHTIRRAIADALSNGVEPSELWQALARLGDLSKPVTGGTLQFAFSELRQPRAAQPAAVGGNVVPLQPGRPAATADHNAGVLARYRARIQQENQ